MTPEQQKETALSLYRLAWRFPEHAPEPRDAQGFDDCEANGHTAYYVKSGIIFVEVFVRNASYARVVVLAGNHRRLSIKGTCGYVENMLRAIPYSLRPHVEASK